MNNMTFNRRDYLEAKGNKEHYAEMLDEKRLEIEELEAELAEAENTLQDLKSSISNGNREMAIGRLSTDQFMELKRLADEKEVRVSYLREAIESQKGALALINDDHTTNRREQDAFLKRSANDLGERYADAVADLAAEPIKDLVQALVVAKGKGRAFSFAERQRDQDAIFQAVGAALCRRVFGNLPGSQICIPDLFPARQHVGELIEKATPQID